MGRSGPLVSGLLPGGCAPAAAWPAGKSILAARAAHGAPSMAAAVLAETGWSLLGVAASR